MVRELAMAQASPQQGGSHRPVPDVHGSPESPTQMGAHLGGGLGGAMHIGHWPVAPTLLGRCLRHGQFPNHGQRCPPAGTALAGVRWRWDQPRQAALPQPPFQRDWGV